MNKVLDTAELHGQHKYNDTFKVTCSYSLNFFSVRRLPMLIQLYY